MNVPISVISPRPNEAVNETWIADRDRFSYQGIYSEDRVLKPMIRDNGMWQETDWETALAMVAERLGKVVKQHGGAQLGALAAPIATLEEFHLLARIARGLGSGNLDHRLRRTDFRDDANDPLYPALGCSIAELEQVASALIVGSNIRKEVPLLAHRLRKAALRGGKVSFVNPQRYEYLFPVAQYLSTNGQDMFGHLVAIAAAASSGKSVPESIAALVASAQPTDSHRAVAQQLGDGSRRMILLGALAQRDPAFADLRLVAGALAELTGATLGYLPDGGNSVAACLAGVLPHRALGGRAAQPAGLNVADMFAARLKSYILLGGIEPSLDIAAPAALEALKAAEFVVALSPYGTAKEFAHVILPVGTFAETSGTYVNLEGRWQSVPGAATPVGESRPAWKVLRVLGNLLNLPGFDYTSSDQITDEVRKQLEAAPAFALKAAARTLQSKFALAAGEGGVSRDVPIYSIDALVRRSSALQATLEARGGSRGRS
jgi:NADH-quinone oxidoreductase subunit G